jgi:hypothetical protein
MDAPAPRPCFAVLPLEIQGRIFENLLEPNGPSTGLRYVLSVCKGWRRVCFPMSTSVPR